MRSQTIRATISFVGLFLFPFSSVFGLPLQSADPSALGPEGSFLAVMPPIQFAVDESLKKNVEFWIRVYSIYTSQQGLVHDAKYIDHVYEVLNFQDSDQKSSRQVKNSKKKWKAVLLSVHRKQKHPETMDTDEKRIFEMFQDVHEPDKFLNAAHRKRLRFQLGQKDRFLDGLYQSGRYLNAMEQIFKKEGMPLELTRLPFVESSFNAKARSKVGASGIWQFMRSTARLFIKVGDAVDERNDPVQATLAAAKLLRLNFESLKNWPLAVTAYNHGRKGMMRAVRKVGSDELEKVVTDYHQRSFGFASSNFFTELLAAIEVEKNAEKYFGKVERAKPTDYLEVQLPDFISARELATRLKFDLKGFRELNPAFTEAVYLGYLLIPANYPVRIPSPQPRTEGRSVSFLDKDAALKSFWEQYAQIPPNFKLKAQRASKYGTSDRSIRHRRRNRAS